MRADPLHLTSSAQVALQDEAKRLGDAARLLRDRGTTLERRATLAVNDAYAVAKRAGVTPDVTPRAPRDELRQSLLSALATASENTSVDPAAFASVAELVSRSAEADRQKRELPEGGSTLEQLEMQLQSLASMDFPQIQPSPLDSVSRIATARDTQLLLIGRALEKARTLAGDEHRAAVARTESQVMSSPIVLADGTTSGTFGEAIRELKQRISDVFAGKTPVAGLMSQRAVNENHWLADKTLPRYLEGLADALEGRIASDIAEQDTLLTALKAKSLARAAAGGPDAEQHKVDAEMLEGAIDALNIGDTDRAQSFTAMVWGGAISRKLEGADGGVSEARRLFTAIAREPDGLIEEGSHARRRTMADRLEGLAMSARGGRFAPDPEKFEAPGFIRDAILTLATLKAFAESA